MLQDGGVDNWGFAENVAMNYAPDWEAGMKKVVDQWMNSAGHRANIMHKKMTHMAVGTFYNLETGAFFYTQLFYF